MKNERHESVGDGCWCKDSSIFASCIYLQHPGCVSATHSCSKGPSFPAIVLKHKVVAGTQCVRAVMKPVWEPIASLSPQLRVPEDHIF